MVKHKACFVVCGNDETGPDGDCPSPVVDFSNSNYCSVFPDKGNE